MEIALAEVNRQLDGREWIVGTAFSLADVAWITVVHRLALMWFPLGAHPPLRRWYRRVRRRPSFARAITAYEPPQLRRRLALAHLRRWCVRSHAGATTWRNPRLLSDA
jgi:glutathione S-transferase